MLSNAVQVAGVIAITIGASLLSIPVGLIVGGVLTVLIGISLERD